MRGGTQSASCILPTEANAICSDPEKEFGCDAGLTPADGMHHGESKQALIRIAEDYEPLAKIAEEMRARKNRS